MSIGQTIRRAREAQGRSLEQIRSETRISVKLLAAIETDDLAQFSSAFFYRSFARQVAEHLGLDYAVVAAQLDDASAQIPKPLVPGECVISGPKVAALRMGRRRGLRWVQSIASLTCALVACSAVYAYWQSAKANHSGIWQRMAVLHDQSDSVSLPEAQVPNRQLNLPGLSKSFAPNGFTLELSATEPAWLSIVADGRVSFKGILERAETKVLEGHRTARIRTGNAGAVEAVFNGKPIGVLGSPGQVRTVVFTRNDYQVLDKPVRISEVEINRNEALTRLLLPVHLAFPVSVLPHS